MENIENTDGIQKLMAFLQDKRNRPGVIAAKLGVSLQTLRNWKHGVYRPEPRFAPMIEKISEGKVKKSDLFPELWRPAKSGRRHNSGGMQTN